MTTTSEPTPASEAELVFGRDLEPAVMAMAQKCAELGMPLSLAIEKEPGNTAYVFSKVDEGAGVTLETAIIRLAIQHAPNIDGIVLGILKFCAANKIDVSGSIVARALTSEARH